MDVAHILENSSEYEIKRNVDLYGLANAFPLPAKFTINLTHRCNLACDMCTQYGANFKNGKGKELSVQEWEKFIQSVEWINPEIVIFGGEPLLYPHIREIFKLTQKYSCTPYIVTNGYYLEEYLEDIMNYNIGLIMSIDGTEKTHNTVRNCKDSFQKIVGCLEKINKNRYKKLFLNCVLIPDNIDVIDEFLEFVIQYNPWSVTLQHPQFSYPKLNKLTNSIWQEYLNIDFKTELLTKKEYDFSKEYINRLAETIARVKTSFSSKVNLAIFPDITEEDLQNYYSEYQHFVLNPGRSCTRPWQRPTINPNGDVLICLDHPIGNITKKSFWEIWGGKEASDFRKMLTVLERFPICTRCVDINI